MAAKMKCPSCGAEIEMPDDPRMGELKDLIIQQNKTIEGLSERLSKATGKEVAPPTVTPPGSTPASGKKKRKRYDGVFFDDDEEVDDDEG